jgi:DNA-directed RNA polymerase subunit RPC12/RpoP
MICPKCGQDNSVKNGHRSGTGDQQWVCRNCNHNFYTPVEIETPDSRTPLVLVLDIETLPMIVYVWDIKYRQWIQPENIVSDYIVLSWAAKWLCESEIQSDVLTTKEALERDDERIIKSIWELIDKADVIIGHNGKRFDLRRLKGRFLYYKMKPPMPYQIIDTMLHAKREFSVSSYKQAYLTKFLGLKEKLHTEYDLWKRCMVGEQKALDYMVEYNRNDVAGLEDLYFALRPWMKSHPNMAIFTEAEGQACPNCGHQDLTWEGKFYTTPAGRYKAFRCTECGAIGRSRFSNLSPSQRSVLLTPTAR